ncbi:MAG: YbhB/YbcL family Raf kinase inhibitor-like protein [Steroidobacteraceae bacterium]|jgi:Raf kinase inhibitor-like YbhB/YbcL family protein
MALSISSPAFVNDGSVPRQYTCDGTNVSPPLQWSGVPSDAKSLVLIVEDPDAPDPEAPKTTWIHWILYNIPPSIHELPADLARHGMPAGALDGLNDWLKTGYGGPCPPIGTHRYFHRLYALSAVLPDLQRPRRSTLMQAMHGKVLAEAALVGLYARRSAR